MLSPVSKNHRHSWFISSLWTTVPSRLSIVLDKNLHYKYSIQICVYIANLVPPYHSINKSILKTRPWILNKKSVHGLFSIHCRNRFVRILPSSRCLIGDARVQVYTGTIRFGTHYGFIAANTYENWHIMDVHCLAPDTKLHFVQYRWLAINLHYLTPALFQRPSKGRRNSNSSIDEKVRCWF